MTRKKLPPTLWLFILTGLILVMCHTPEIYANSGIPNLKEKTVGTQFKKTPALPPATPIPAPKADPAITSMIWSNPVKEGARIGMESILNLIIKNHGAVETQPTTVRFTCAGGCPAILNGSRPVPKIPAGKNVGINWPESSLSTWPSGTFTLEAIVDPSNQLADSNRMNNRKKIVFTVTPSLPAMQQKTTIGVQQAPISSVAIKPTIKVNHPASGEVWRIDTPQTVSWTKIGDMGPNVSITLLSAKGNVPPQPVVLATLNSGNYTIPAGFFKNLPFSDFSLRVETTNDTIVGNSGVFKLAPPPLNVSQMSYITVLEPIQDVRFEEGGKITIRFESNMTQPFQFVLVESGSQKKVMDSQVGSVQQQDANIFSADWTLPEGDYSILTKYRLRVSNGSIHGISAPFVIQNIMKTTTYEIPATITINKFITYSKKNSNYEDTPDPGPGRLRVGYSFASRNDEQALNSIYRSWVFFDLRSIQGKGLVTKAVLKFSHYAGCNTFTPFVGILNEKWNGGAEALFVGIDNIGINPSALPVNRVSDWITKPDDNHGLVFIGPNEMVYVARENDICVGLYDDVKLVVEMTK